MYKTSGRKSVDSKVPIDSKATKNTGVNINQKKTGQLLL